MPKKPTQAEKDAIAAAAAEAERLALEAEVKRIEDLRLKREEEVRRKMAAQIDFRVAEIELLKKEAEAGLIREKEIAENLKESDAQEVAARDWNKHILCSSLPDASSESDVNTYISQNMENLSNDFDEALDECAITEIVTKEVRKEMAYYESIGDIEKCQTCYEMCLRLRQTTVAKIDQATLYLIQQADEFTTSDDNAQVLLTKQRPIPNIKFGIWANLITKPVRGLLKFIHYKDISLQVDIPKQLNQLKIAVRIYHLPYSAADDRYENPNSTDFVLGGLINVDIIYLPSPPKQVKPQWTIRSTTVQCSELQKLPFGEDHQYAILSPIKVHIIVPESVHLINMSNLKVVVWDVKNKKWTSEGVQQDTLDYHRDTRALRFLTQKTGQFALAASRVMNLPYNNWSLAPALPVSLNDDCLDVDQEEVSCVHYTLVTRYATVKVQIMGSTCQLLEPEIKDLHLKEMPPGELLFALRDAGINLLPQDQDVAAVNELLTTRNEYVAGNSGGEGGGGSEKSVSGEGVEQSSSDTQGQGEVKEPIDLLQSKSRELECKVYKEMASVAAAFDLEASRWNRKIGNGRSAFQVRETSVYTGGNMEVEDYGMALIELDQDSQSYHEAPDVGPIVEPGMKCSLIQQLEAKPIPSLDDLEKNKKKNKSPENENGQQQEEGGGGGEGEGESKIDPVAVDEDLDEGDDEDEEDESVVKGEQFNETRLPNATTHIYLAEALKFVSSEEAMDRVSRASPQICRTLERILLLTRPISFS